MLNNTRSIITIAVCAFFSSLPGSSKLYGQQIQFTRLPIFQDATWLVTGIIQDRQGYMWFGTKRTGLYRYDGYEIVAYKNQVSNDNSLSYDAIESLYADKDGIIWIGTFGKGLDRFDPATGRFTHFQASPGDPGSLANDTVICITEDDQHNLWLGTYGGVSRMDKRTGEFISYRHQENDAGSLSCNQIRAIYQDKKGTMWVGTGSGFYENDSCNTAGLNRFDKNTGKFTHYFHDDKDTTTLADNRVRAIYEDSRGVFYVGTAGNGLHTMDRTTGKFTRLLYNPKYPQRLSRPPLRYNLDIADDHITFINEDATGALWIGSFNGVNRYDPVTKRLQYFPSFTANATSGADNVGWMAFTSHDGVLWFSTLGTGNIYHLDPFLKKVNHFDIGDQVNCIYKESVDVLWIGTQFSGLIRKDRAGGSQKFFSFPGITAIRPVDNNKLWIGTIAGLYLFDTKTGKSILTDPKIPGAAANEIVISSLWINNNKNLWIGSTRGLTYFDSKKKSFSHFRHNPNDSNSIGELPVTSVLEDNAGRVWIGLHPDGGVNVYDQRTKKFKRYLEGRGITGTILRDAAGTVWAGTHDGLYRYNVTTDNFTPFPEPATGASLNYILNLLEDADQNLWVVTGKELLRISKTRNEIIHFGKNEGVKPNTGYWGSNVGGDGQEIFYGDQTGYYDFYPAGLTVNHRPPQILLTDFAIKDHKSRGNPDELLRRDESIKLRHNENVFSFNAVPIHYSNPADNRLVYMLDNYDDTWRELAPGQRLYYFNLSPGKYTLRIKAANGNGVWTQKNIPIIVTPPWWQRWWAIASMIFLLGGTIWIIIVYRSRNLVKEKRILEQKVSLRTREVVEQKEEIITQRDKLKNALEELQNTQAQLVQREKMASLGELTAGIAHEIQNPLNFVKNFSEINVDLLEEINEAMNRSDPAEMKEIFADLRQNTEKVLLHGKRADSIVKGMLHHFRSSSHKEELTDINDLVDECLRLTYHGMRAKDKAFNATFKTDYGANIPEISIIRQDVGRVFLNLFTNAFYAVTQKKILTSAAGQQYEPTVAVTTKQLDGTIEVIVKDNGKGIPREFVDKIFQPFFTTKPTGEGTGLGLSLSYDIIKAHGGEITVETKEGEGSDFIIQLPIV